MTAAGLSSGASGASALSIGSVLDALRADFPEITISKIRFLESEGLISPSRTAAGYRQFSHTDVERLRFVLSAQRDHYLPLKVIRAKLEEFDSDPEGTDLRLDDSGGYRAAATATATLPAPPQTGGPAGPGGPGGPGGSGGPGAPGRYAGTAREHADRAADRRDRGLSAVSVAGSGRSTSEDPETTSAETVVRGAGPVPRETLLAEDGADEALIAALETYGILRPDVSGRYEPEAPMVVRTAAALARLGVEPRLLRGARASADREVGLLTQLLTPVARSRAPESARRAEELSSELASLSGRLHALLVGAGLRGELRR